MHSPAIEINRQTYSFFVDNSEGQVIADHIKLSYFAGERLDVLWIDGPWWGAMKSDKQIGCK